jgi:hypothetical protein
MREGREVLTQRGFDPDSFWEQPVVWGELDSFQYVRRCAERTKIDERIGT